jgi:flavin reductase (DIM6/NTAB) family NADH-FMN oxidoreductase RutF
VLAEGHDEACLQLASKDGDRFAGIEWDRSPHDSVFIGSSTAWFEVSLFDEVMAGDHVIALLEVHGMEIFTENAPLIFHHSKFHKLAPTQPKS